MSTASDVADTLYALPPKAFTAARDEQVAGARNAGERALAAEIGALKRPTAAAWLVNLVALRRPDAVDSLVTLGQTIRDAQGAVSATELRELSNRRRAELDSVLAVVRRLADDAGETATQAQLTEVEGTLAAAMADPGAAEQVRAGRVLKALTYSGFGAPDVGAFAPATRPATKTPPARAAPAGSPGTRRGAPAEPDAAETAAAAARLSAAREQVEAATAALSEAEDAEQAVRRRADELTGQIAALTEELDRIHRDARGARQSRLAAERDLASAQRRFARLHPPDA
jgi:hypothetical protein